MKLHQAELIAGTETPIGEGRNKPFRAMVRMDGGLLPAVVKKLTKEEMLAEAAAALILSDWGLPVPQAAVINTGNDWFFASVDGGYPNLKQRLGWSDNLPPSHQHAISTVGAAVACSLPDAGKLLAADEAIANEDRNLGNILWDGDSHAYIDHEMSLGVVPHTNNKMVAMANIASMTEEIQQKAVASALTLSMTALKQWDIPDNVDIEHLISYVESRIPSLASRVLARFPKPADLLSGI